MPIYYNYLGLAKVDYVTAESLMNELYNILNEKGIDITKVMFISFDGCNTYLPSPCCARRHIGQGLELSTLLYPELSSLFLTRLSPFPLALPGGCNAIS